jgi:hypothetical protein
MEAFWTETISQIKNKTQKTGFTRQATDKVLIFLIFQIYMDKKKGIESKLPLE